MCGHFAFLQRVELFELFQAERKDVVIQRSRCTTEQFVELRLITGDVPFHDRDGAANVPSRLSFNPDISIADKKVQPSAVSPAIQRLVTPDAAAAVKPKHHGADESHQCAFARLVGAVKDVQSRTQFIPRPIVPYAKAID